MTNETTTLPSIDGTDTAGGEGFWQREATDVQGIEKALVALRKEYGSAATAKEGHAGTRNSVANLVVYAASDEDAELVTATMAQLAGAHPARTILLIANLAPDAPDVTASVSAACSLQSGKRICYEEIRLHARGRSGPHLRSIIEPLLVAELPVFLWWTGDPPFRDEVFLTLARLSDHVIIDSSRFQSPSTTLDRLGRLIEDDSVSATIGDLNWPRLSAWRELLCQLFDPPAMTPLLSQIRRIRIERAAPEAGAPSSPAQSLLLAGWLATRLGWEPGKNVERTTAGAYRVKMRGAGHEITIELRPELQRQAVPGDVQSVLVQTESGDQMGTFTITRSADQEHAATTVIVERGVLPERSVNFRTASDPELLDEEMESLDRDAIFEDAVAMAGQLARALPDGTSPPAPLLPERGA